MSGVPLNISNGLKAAIHEAVKEEKASVFRRLLKATFAASVSTVFVIGGYVLLLREQAFHHGISFFASFFVILFSGFYLYFKPEPHWVVRGHWSPWSYGALFVLMGILTAIQFLICPHFVLLHQASHGSFAPLDALAEQYHHWGGVPGSKFLCGLTFSAIASLVVIAVFKKQFWGAKSRQLLRIGLLLLVAQFPAVLLQLMDEHLRPLSWIWLSGSFVSVVLILVVLRLLFVVSFRKST